MTNWLKNTHRKFQQAISFLSVTVTLISFMGTVDASAAQAPTGQVVITPKDPDFVTVPLPQNGDLTQGLSADLTFTPPLGYVGPTPYSPGVVSNKKFTWKLTAVEFSTTSAGPFAAPPGPGKPPGSLIQNPNPDSSNTLTISRSNPLKDGYWVFTIKADATFDLQPPAGPLRRNLHAAQGTTQIKYRAETPPIRSVSICEPKGGAWKEQPWAEVLLVGDDLKIKVIFSERINTLQEFINKFGKTISVRSFSVSSTGVEKDEVAVNIEINKNNAQIVAQELRVTVAATDVKSLKLVSEEEDGIEEKCSADRSSLLPTDPDQQNPTQKTRTHRGDSDGFDGAALGIQRGLARGPSNGAGNIAAKPPEGSTNKTFIQAAGVLCIDAQIKDIKSEKKQIENQADVFYFSGHGRHKTGELVDEPTPKKFITIASPADLINHWKDLNKLIIAGCAVLDVGDYNEMFDEPAEHKAAPGKKWINLGPTILCGYNAHAPLDNNVGDPDFTKSIIVNYLKSEEGTEARKWLLANRNQATVADPTKPGGRPYNACVLEKEAAGWVYYWLDKNRLDIAGKPSINRKPQAAW